MWFMLAGAALSAASARSEQETAFEQGRLKAELGNKTRSARNAVTAAQGNLQRFSQSLNNKRALESGGEAIVAGRVNLSRQKAAITAQSFTQSIRQAEADGAARAAQAASGVRGEVADMVNGASALRASMARQSVVDQTKTLTSDSIHRISGIAAQMVAGLDTSTILSGLDYNTDINTSPIPENPGRAFTLEMMTSGVADKAANFAGAAYANRQATPDLSGNMYHNWMLGAPNA